ncbi:HDOD domain-containing protein [Paraglaciecola aquimarina]|uniref:HDOD domain-containing protein n=1 Tax=Paraglaciecola algarum TaxID=3050085 RepID=A0ABS9DF49_9ALTE|nr:HDOD domain-containing protein [Paraglaciecola sp. G1-23]MCF2950231.1 HDOD domain-containing protein [Paraglaciecola sp. G1-23]
MNESVLLARQPIFDSNNNLYAHEILYRSESSLGAGDISQISTRELLVNACTNILNDNINLGLPMFVNIDEEFLLADDFFPIAPKNLIFEILETIPPTEIIIEKLGKLKRLGFEFALDDYLLEKSKVPYFKYLKVIKVDLLDVDFEQLVKSMPTLKMTRCLLLAEKVEDQQMFDRCIELGFDLFQGYYLERPKIIKGRKIGASQQLVLNLVSELSRNDIEVEEVAELISRDVGLSVKILSLINCPLYQLVREVKSVKDAVVILGLTTVKQWAITLALVAESSRPKELFRAVLVRAKTLSLYSAHTSTGNKQVESSTCFLVGLLSGIEAIFEIDMVEILDHIVLDVDIKSALLGQENQLGALLKNSIGMERFDSRIFEQLSNQEICLFNRCYRDALKWADEVMDNLA